MMVVILGIVSQQELMKVWAHVTLCVVAYLQEFVSIYSQVFVGVRGIEYFHLVALNTLSEVNKTIMLYSLCAI